MYLLIVHLRLLQIETIDETIVNVCLYVCKILNRYLRLLLHSMQSSFAVNNIMMINCRLWTYNENKIISFNVTEEYLFMSKCLFVLDVLYNYNRKPSIEKLLKHMWPLALQWLNTLFGPRQVLFFYKMQINLLTRFFN